MILSLYVSNCVFPAGTYSSVISFLLISVFFFSLTVLLFFQSLSPHLLFCPTNVWISNYSFSNINYHSITIIRDNVSLFEDIDTVFVVSSLKPDHYQHGKIYYAVYSHVDLTIRLPFSIETRCQAQTKLSSGYKYDYAPWRCWSTVSLRSSWMLHRMPGYCTVQITSSFWNIAMVWACIMPVIHQVL